MSVDNLVHLEPVKINIPHPAVVNIPHPAVINIPHPAVINIPHPAVIGIPHPAVINIPHPAVINNVMAGTILFHNPLYCGAKSIITNDSMADIVLFKCIVQYFWSILSSYEVLLIHIVAVLSVKVHPFLFHKADKIVTVVLYQPPRLQHCVLPTQGDQEGEAHPVRK